MSFTNKTENYNLPQWLPDDKPTFLEDMNGAYREIDSQMKANSDSASSAALQAQNAATSAAAAVESSHQNAEQLVTVNNRITAQSDQITQIQSLIGSGIFTPRTGTLTSNISGLVTPDPYGNYCVVFETESHVMLFWGFNAVYSSDVTPSSTTTIEFVIDGEALPIASNTISTVMVLYTSSPTPTVRGSRVSYNSNTNSLSISVGNYSVPGVMGNMVALVEKAEG